MQRKFVATKLRYIARAPASTRCDSAELSKWFLLWRELESIALEEVAFIAYAKMIPIINYLYSDTWDEEDITFLKWLKSFLKRQHKELTDEEKQNMLELEKKLGILRSAQ